MATLIRFTLLTLLALGLAACDDESSKKKTAVSAEPVVLTVPSSATDDKGWGAYMKGVVKENMKGIRGRPTVYFLGSSQGPDFEGRLQGMEDSVGPALQRGIVPRSIVAFGSPESATMADLMVSAFNDTQPGSLREVRILFIGNAEDRARVEEAVTATGAEFVFHEAK